VLSQSSDGSNYASALADVIASLVDWRISRASEHGAEIEAKIFSTVDLLCVLAAADNERMYVTGQSET
jgi:hypothetical protein